MEWTIKTNIVHFATWKNDPLILLTVVSAYINTKILYFVTQLQQQHSFIILTFL